MNWSRQIYFSICAVPLLLCIIFSCRSAIGPSEDTVKVNDTAFNDTLNQDGTVDLTNDVTQVDGDMLLSDAIENETISQDSEEFDIGPYYSTLLVTLEAEAGLRKLTDQDGDPIWPQDEFGHLIEVDGEPFQQLTALAEKSIDEPPEPRQSYLYFLVISDCQLSDEESPGLTPSTEAVLGGIISAGYKPQEAYLPKVFDAVIETANQFSKDRPYDFMIHMGDALENAQKNELRWFIDILDGLFINPDSGLDNDPLEGPGNDGNDPFQAVGLDQRVPWYSVIGNHDILSQGNYPPLVLELINQPQIRSAMDEYLSAFDIKLPLDTTGTVRLDFIDPEEEIPPDLDEFDLHEILYGQKLKNLPTETIPADPDRQYVSKLEFMQEHFNTVSTPVGHGFTNNNVNYNTGFYTFKPVYPLPIKMIVLNSANPSGGSQGILAPPQKVNGGIDTTKLGNPLFDQIQFLKDELKSAQENDELVIVGVHHYTKGAGFNDINYVLAFLKSYDPLLYDQAYDVSPEVEGSLTGPEFRDILLDHPNVILLLTGHGHENAVNVWCPDGEGIFADDYESGMRCVPPTDGKTMVNGFYEIQTGSVIDFPQQTRIIELVDNRDGTLSIYSTMIDHKSQPFSLANVGRFLSVVDIQVGLAEVQKGHMLDRNVEIIVPLTPQMKDKLANFQGHELIESVTTLMTPQ